MVHLQVQDDSGPGVYSIAIQTQWDSVHTGPGVYSIAIQTQWDSFDYLLPASGPLSAAVLYG
jgi:hypothetical protein